MNVLKTVGILTLKTDELKKKLMSLNSNIDLNSILKDLSYENMIDFCLASQK